jgi:hypothetical protein
MTVFKCILLLSLCVAADKRDIIINYPFKDNIINKCVAVKQVVKNLFLRERQINIGYSYIILHV